MFAVSVHQTRPGVELSDENFHRLIVFQVSMVVGEVAQPR
jgi:hypothetical protein